MHLTMFTAEFWPWRGGAKAVGGNLGAHFGEKGKESGHDSQRGELCSN